MGIELKRRQELVPMEKPVNPISRIALPATRAAGVVTSLVASPLLVAFLLGMAPSPTNIVVPEPPYQRNVPVAIAPVPTTVEPPVRDYAPPDFPPQHPYEDPSAPRCEVQVKPKAGESLVVLGVYEGSALAPYSLAGGERTDAAVLTIEPGSTPLYLVLASHQSMVWKLTGAVERVAHVIPTSFVRAPNSGLGFGGTGVIGVENTKVTFLQSGQCVGYFHEPSSMDALKAKAGIYKLLGKAPDVMGGVYQIGSASLPSMSLVPPPRLRMTAEGIPPMPVMDLGSGDLISPVKAIALGVLPQKAGIEQLLREGKLMSIGNRTYRIVGPIVQFPAGLHGGHRVDFVLGKGVPMPGGDPGHSCVRSEETGQVLAGLCI